MFVGRGELREVTCIKKPPVKPEVLEINFI